MTAEPRMVVDLTGTSIRRAVIDTRAQYLALFSRTALLLLERDGREYRQADGCYRVAPGGHLTTQSFWAGTVDDVTGGAHSTKASGDSVIYRSSGGELVVDSRTDLVRSTRFAGFASGGVAATTATFLYPRSVTELAAPRRLCH